MPFDLATDRCATPSRIRKLVRPDRIDECHPLGGECPSMCGRTDRLHFATAPMDGRSVGVIAPSSPAAPSGSCRSAPPSVPNNAGAHRCFVSAGTPRRGSTATPSGNPTAGRTCRSIRLGVELASGDARVEDDVALQAVPRGHVFEIPQDLGLLGIALAPRPLLQQLLVERRRCIRSGRGRVPARSTRIRQGGAVASRGSLTLNVVPPSSLDVTSIAPWCAVATSRAM